MSRFDHLPDVAVPIGPCLCPDTPHPGGDVVYLTAQLSAQGGMAAQGAIADGFDDAVRLQELLWRIYRDHGIVSWNLLDEDGEPVPLTPSNIERALPFGKGGRAVADAADDLYNADVLAPFLERVRALIKEAELAKKARKRNGSPKPSRHGTTTSSPAVISAALPSPPKRRPRSSMPDTEAATPGA